MTEDEARLCLVTQQLFKDICRKIMEHEGKEMLSFCLVGMGSAMAELIYEHLPDEAQDVAVEHFCQSVRGHILMLQAEGQTRQ